jgi:hypothetical protein
MRDGPTLSSEGPAGEPASVISQIQRMLIGRTVTGLDVR